MRFRNYLIQMADRSAFYVNAKEGMDAMKSYAKGQNILVRGRLVAYHMISLIRPCNAEEDQQAEETIKTEERALQLQAGELKIVDNKESFSLISTHSEDVSMQKMLS